ncbi:retropepsin-like aspartic protease family protein [Marichromatium bheemlicum]|uniref:Aspartyl protease family protein n=1 Tax=Marichromatium bheemlicum TaxID=365339 RepID=A0ABX1I7F2_9GAMM|nr:retroviral-like aspartic protease family protein [Marichromatium bheemlicum]NKN33493.1 hypothetical protein [Marichromatium bheemlicum]
MSKAYCWSLGVVLFVLSVASVAALDPCSAGMARAAGGEARFYRDSSGAHRLRGRIGRTAVTFELAPAVDTLVLGEREAARLGLRAQRGGVVRYRDSSGIRVAHSLVLDSVQVGDIVRERVRAVVVSGEDAGVVLLGQSFLRGLARCRDAGAVVLYQARRR